MIEKLHGMSNNKILIKYASIIDIILSFLVVFKVDNISKLIIFTWIFYNLENSNDIKKINVNIFREILKNTFKKCIISKAEDFNDILYCIDILIESNYVSINKNATISISFNIKEHDILNKNLNNLNKYQTKIINNLIKYDTIILLKELLDDNNK